MHCSLLMLTGSAPRATLKILRVCEWMAPMLMAYCMHLRAIPKRKILVIFKSTGRLTKIRPKAVIFGTYFS